MKTWTSAALCAALALATGITASAQTPTAPAPLVVTANGVSLIDFGNQPLNVATTPKAVLIQNAGNAVLNISSVSLVGLAPGDFSIANNGCGTVAIGGTCSVTITFRPTANGGRSARLRLVDDASGSPQEIPLFGNGADPNVRQKSIGPVDARHGYPISATDQNGLTLGLCWDNVAFCLTTVPDPTLPPSVTDALVNFPDESFWFAADAEITPWPLGQRARLVLATEAAFTADMIPGGQAMFGRIRYRFDGLLPNTQYRITHPYGRDLITTDDAGEIFTTEDIGCLSAPCDYNLIKNSRVWPFLTWDPSVAPAAPTGYIGDPNVPHQVVGSPIGQNVFRIEQVVGTGFVLIGETNLFSVSGQIVNAPPPVTPPVGTATVPNVLSQLQADAQNLIATAGLTVGVVTTQNSNTVAAGRVIAQSPTGGASVAPGTAVILTVSLGPANVSVPTVTGLTQTAAQNAITAATLTVGTVTTANSATAAGLVISQSPAAGASVAPGTAVLLTVSLGPANVSVPTVTGLTQAAAQSAITGATLAVGTVTTANSATAAGLVISQNPAAGTSVQPNTAVSFVISLGPAVPAGNPVVVTSAFADGTGPRSATVNSIAAGDLLLALVGSDGPTPGEGANTQSMTVSGASLAWARVTRANTSRGVSEIWAAIAPAALASATITSTQSVTVVLGAPVNQSLAVIAIRGASGVGASAIASRTTTNATVNLTAQAAGSLVFGVGNDFDRAVARVAGAGQTKIHEFQAPTGDTFWMQQVNAATTAAGQVVTVNATAAGAADQWNLAAVEIKR